LKLAQENIERIHKVVKHIELNIDSEMPLDDLAELACFSPFHFQRIFKEVLGETPKQFIKRLRLEEAARIIAFQPELNILEVAVKVGFQSLEAFSRAFKDYYSLSPDKYRKSSEIERINITQIPYSKNILIDEAKIEISFPEHKPEFEDLKPEIVNRPGQKCVCLQTTLQSPVLIKESFKRIKQWAEARDLINGETAIFGLIKDYPVFTSLDKCRFLTCVALGKQTITSGLVSFLEIPSTKYVSFVKEGSFQDIIKTASYVVHAWLPESAFKLKLEPILLVPLNDPSITDFNENSYQIYIPVEAE